MDELISREAVFNAINRIKTKRNETWYEFYQKIMTAVGKISPAKPNWIPCSERMPKTNDPVNVTYVNHNPGNYYAEVKDKPYTATAHFHKGQWYWYSCTTQDLLDEYGTWIPDLIDKDVEITAWAELPEPFKGGDEMSRLDQVIADITYVRSCLKLLKTIQESGDCNICKKKRTCEYVPKLGEQVRYNCPFFESEVRE